MYFIPAGYDSDSLLNSFDIQGDLSKSYNERILPSKVKSTLNEEEIISEDSQMFLKKFYGQNSISSKARLNEPNKLNKENSKSTIKTTSTVKLEKFKNTYNQPETINSNRNTNNDYGSESNKSMFKMPSNSNFDSKLNSDAIKDKEKLALVGDSSRPITSTTSGNATGLSASELVKKRLNDLKKK